MGEEKKRLPVGLENFEQIIKEEKLGIGFCADLCYNIANREGA